MLSYSFFLKNFFSHSSNNYYYANTKVKCRGQWRIQNEIEGGAKFKGLSAARRRAKRAGKF